MRLTSVRLRLTLWNVGVLALVLIVLGVTLRYAVQAQLAAGLDRSLVGMTGRFAANWATLGLRGMMPPPSFLANQTRRQDAEGRQSGASQAPPSPFRLLDRGRKHPFTRRPETPWDAATFARALRGEKHYATIKRGTEATRVYSVPLIYKGRVEAVLQAARPLTEIRREVDRLTRTLLTLIPVALLIAAVGGAFLTDRALRPVRAVTRAAGRIEATALSERLAVTGGHEFAELATTFNGMLDRLETAFGRLERSLEQERRFTADASHELRTPLTVIKANSSLALRGQRPTEEYRRALEAIDLAADTTNRIVQDLLLLARADAGQLVIERAPVRITEVLEQASGTVTGPEGAAVDLEIPDPTLAVAGDAHHLGRLFRNLLENAARHTPSEGRIHVSTHGEGESVIVAVQDTGEGIPPEHLPHVTERFYRVDAARSRQQGGTGLGLAICRSIVAAHHGAMTIESTVGVGTTVRVHLPRATVAAPQERALAAGTATARQA